MNILTDFMKSIKQKIKKSPLLAFCFAKQRQKFNFAPKNGWRARVAGEPNASFSNWRALFDEIRTELQVD